MTYAAGWTPCVGPIFSAVLMLGATNPEGALLYITAYTLGFAVPFFVMAFFIGKVKWIVTYANVMMKIGGGMMIVTGIFIVYKSNDENYSILYSSIRWIYRF